MAPWVCTTRFPQKCPGPQDGSSGMGKGPAAAVSGHGDDATVRWGDGALSIRPVPVHPAYSARGRDSSDNVDVLRAPVRLTLRNILKMETGGVVLRLLMVVILISSGCRQKKTLELCWPRVSGWPCQSQALTSEWRPGGCLQEPH